MGSESSDNNQINPAKAIVDAIDGYLDELFRLFSFSFGGGTANPEGDFAKKKRIFELTWEYLNAAQFIPFEKEMELEKYYTNFQKNLDYHLNDYCREVDLSQDLFSDNKKHLLSTIANLVKVLMMYRFVLLKLNENDVQAYVHQIADLIKACNAAEDKLIFINRDELKSEMKSLIMFARTVATGLNKKGYTDFTYTYDTEKHDVDDEYYSRLRESLNMMPERKDLIRYTDSLNSPDKASINVNNIKHNIREEIHFLRRVYNDLVRVAPELKKKILQLNKLLSIENEARPYIEKMHDFRAITSIDTMVEFLAGISDGHGVNNSAYKMLKTPFNDCKNACSSQSQLERVTIGFYSYGWGNLYATLSKIELELTESLKNLCDGYFQQTDKLVALYERRNAVHELNQTITHLRMMFVTQVSRVDNILHTAISRIDADIKTLGEHLDTQLTYTRDFFLHHWHEMLLCGGAGGGASTLVSCLTAAHPSLLVLLPVGLVVGTSVGASFGLARDECRPRKAKKPAVLNKINLIKEIDTTIYQAGAPKQPWYKRGFFAKDNSKNNEQDDIIVRRNTI